MKRIETLFTANNLLKSKFGVKKYKLEELRFIDNKDLPTEQESIPVMDVRTSDGVLHFTIMENDLVPVA